MKHEVRVFCIWVRSPEEGAEALNRYLASVSVLSMSKEFVSDGGNSFWSVWVEARGSMGTPETVRGPKVDYALKLTPEQFKVFRALRDYRKKVADAEGVPAFSILTNEQLAQIVERQVVSLSGLSEVPGIGTSRVERYGKAIVEVLTTMTGSGRVDPGAR